MDVWTWIFVICAVGILGIWILHPSWEPEGFQNVPKDLPWVQSSLDEAARQGNACNVLERFPDKELTGAVIEIMEESCESGLPHTVGLNQIRIPKSAWTTSERRAAILRHERIHLRQRRDPEKWRDFYKREWMYTIHTEPPSIIASAANGMRGNPDTWPERWACWKGRYWFVPSYTSHENPTLPQASVKIWDNLTHAWIEEYPQEWRMLFCSEQGKCPFQSEHPAEISAEYATDLADWTTPAAMALRRFLEK